MLGALSNGNNVAFTQGEFSQVPFGDCGLTTSHSVEEDGDRHDERERAHSDVHLSMSDCVVGDLVNEGGKGCDDGGQGRLLLLNVPSRPANEALTLVSLKPFFGPILGSVA